MQTRKERAEISISDPAKKKPDLSSDRDSIAVDRGRARITFSIRIRKGIALIACDSLSMLVSGEVPQTRSFKSF